MEFTTTAQHALNAGIKVCVYGRSGIGKTTLIATAPRPIIASAEGGTLSIARHNIKAAIIRSYKDLYDFYQWLRSSVEAASYDTVALDSISEIGEVLLSEEKSKTKDGRQAYGEMADKINIMIRLFRDLPGKHVYFTAKAEIKKQPDGTELYTASMPGAKVAQGLPYFFDEFFYLGVGELDTGGKKTSYRYLQTVPDIRYEAKDRSGALDPMEEPNLTKLFAKIMAGYKPA